MENEKFKIADAGRHSLVSGGVSFTKLIPFLTLAFSLLTNYVVSIFDLAY